MTPKILALFDYGTPEDVMHTTTAAVAAFFPQATMVRADAAWQEHRPATGGQFDAWIDLAANGATLGAPHYHAYVVSTVEVGRVNGAIVDKALGAGKPVYHADGDTVTPVVSAHKLPVGNQGRWVVTLGSDRVTRRAG